MNTSDFLGPLMSAASDLHWSMARFAVSCCNSGPFHGEVHIPTQMLHVWNIYLHLGDY
jgi:hypothetical protein